MMRKAELTCKRCGKTFQAKPYEMSKGRKFCSHQCYWEAKKIKTEKKRCIKCGKVMERTGRLRRSLDEWATRKFCSSECGLTYKSKEFPDKTCEGCGKVFRKFRNASVGRWKNRRFCSRKCFDAKKRSDSQRNCEICGKVISGPQAYRRKTCSTACTRALRRDVRLKRVEWKCQTCGKVSLLPPNIAKRKKYCSRSCFSKHSSMVKLPCVYCQKEIQVYPSRIGRVKHHFCSLRCRSDFRIGERGYWTGKKRSEADRKAMSEGALEALRTGRRIPVTGPRPHMRGEKNPFWKPRDKVTCEHCGNKFYKKPAEMEKRKAYFCSIECYHQSDYVKKLASKQWENPEFRKKMYKAFARVVREGSKPEKYAYTYIDEALDGIEVRLKDWSILRNQEIDICIPSMKAAIEYQGIHHYVPIRGEKMFKKRVEGDKRKKERLERKGWRILYIDGRKELRINELEEQCDRIIKQLPGFEDWIPPQKKLKTKL